MGRKAYFSKEDIETFIGEFVEANLCTPSLLALQKHFGGGFLGRYKTILDDWKESHALLLQEKSLKRNLLPVNTKEFRRSLIAAIEPLLISSIEEGVEKNLAAIVEEKEAALNETKELTLVNDRLTKEAEIHKSEISMVRGQYEDRIQSLQTAKEELVRQNGVLEGQIQFMQKKIEEDGTRISELQVEVKRLRELVETYESRKNAKTRDLFTQDS